MKAVSFSGYRPEKFDFSLEKSCEEFIQLMDILEEKIEELIKSDYKIFYIGGCDGFDLLVGQVLLKLKKDYDIKIILAMPYESFGKKFKSEWKEILYILLKEADDTVYVSHKYSFGCYQKRNEFMINNSEILITYFNGKKGGTLNTIKYANKLNREIINIFSHMENNFFE